MARQVVTNLQDEVSLAPVIDAVCAEILAGWAAGESYSTLRLSPTVYDLIATSKAAEIARGNPVMLLSLDVVADDAMPVTRAELT